MKIYKKINYGVPQNFCFVCTAIITEQHFQVYLVTV